MPHLNERQRRVLVGALAEALGHGGQRFVVEATGMSSSTISKAVREVRAGIAPSDRQRAEGGGDKPAIDKQPGLLEALDELVHPDTRGNPMSPLRWTLKSTYELADTLVGEGYKASAELVRRLLHQLGYSLQAPSKQLEGTQHPDRNSQFEYLNRLAGEFLESGDPVISVDTKKKELIGNYANGGSEWQPEGEPVETNTHDGELLPLRSDRRARGSTDSWRDPPDPPPRSALARVVPANGGQTGHPRVNGGQTRARR